MTGHRKPYSDSVWHHYLIFFKNRIKKIVKQPCFVNMDISFFLYNKHGKLWEDSFEIFSECSRYAYLFIKTRKLIKKRAARDEQREGKSRVTSSEGVSRAWRAGRREVARDEQGEGSRAWWAGRREVARDEQGEGKSHVTSRERGKSRVTSSERGSREQSTCFTCRNLNLINNSH